MRILLIGLMGISLTGAGPCTHEAAPSTPAADAAPALWGDLVPGPYTVGFRVIRDSDTARGFRPRSPEGAELDPIARPIQISLWYPAATATRSSPLAFGNYAELLGLEGQAATLDSAHAEDGRREMVQYLISLGAGQSAATHLLATETAAHADAKPARGRFPLVVILSGKDGSPLEHVVLAEYLASYGFLVAATPAMGTDQRAMAWTGEDVLTQLRDLDFVLGLLTSEASADLTQIGLVGFSFGAGPAVMAGRQRDGVRAIVSLDGSIGFRDRIPVYRAIMTTEAHRLAPVLHFNVLGEERNEIDYLDSLAPELAVASLSGATHLAFTSLGMFRRAVPDLNLAPFADLPDPARVHMIALALTRAFLVAHLTDKPEEWSAIAAQAPKLGNWPPDAGRLRVR